MVTVRWLRLGARSGGWPPIRLGSHDGSHDESLDSWLETVHRLAARRAPERIRLARAGDTTRERLRRRS